MHFKFQHCYREANKVADALANYGCDQASSMAFPNPSSIPSSIRSSIALESQDVPYIRIS